MIFDRFCSIVERHFPEYRKIAEDAKIFIFEEPAHLVLPKDEDAAYTDEIDLFALPFQVTAVEDPASLIILVDSKPDLLGIDATRYFIEVIPMYGFDKNFGITPPELSDEDLHKELKRKGFDEDTCMISFGVIESLDWRSVNYKITGTVSKLISASKKKVYENVKVTPFSPSNITSVSDLSLKNAVTAIEELLLVSSKKNFVLEQAPLTLKNQQKNKAKKILRSHQRPTYTILDARSIRDKLDLPQPEHSSINQGERKRPVPHERRRHPRRLRAEKGFYKEDKVIIIPATWIGQSEKIVGNKIYKVRLDI